MSPVSPVFQGGCVLQGGVVLLWPQILLIERPRVRDFVVPVHEEDADGWDDDTFLVERLARNRVPHCVVTSRGGEWCVCVICLHQRELIDA